MASGVPQVPQALSSPQPRCRRTHLLPGLPFHHICTADPGRIKMWAGGWGQMLGGGDCKSCCLLAPPSSFPCSQREGRAWERTDSLRLRFNAAATTLSHGAMKSQQPAAHPGRSGACSPTRAYERAPQPATGALRSAADPSEQRPTTRAATGTRPGSCHPSPFWRILFSKRIRQAMKPSHAAWSNSQILGVFLVCKI